MSRVGFAFVLLLSTVAGFPANQATATAQLVPALEKGPSFVPYKPSHSSGSIPLPACPTTFEFHPEIDGIYKGGTGITPPKITQAVTVGLTKAARQAYKNNLFKDPNDVVSRISFVVDMEGHPKNLCLQTPAGFGLDERAADAVRQYRFNPATKDGKPIAMRMTVEVRYQTH